MTSRRWLPWLLGAALVALLLLAFAFLPLAAWLDAVIAAVHDLGALGVALYALAYVASTVAFVPATLLTLGAGLVWGPLWGVAVVSPVSVAAATTAFLLGRHVLRDRVAARLARSPRLAALDTAIAQRGPVVVLLLRLSPIIPFGALNYALSLTGVRLLHFVLASWVGMLPATFLYVYLGSTLPALGETVAAPPDSAAATAETALFWGGLAATLLVTVLLTRLARRALRLPQAPDAAPEPPTPPREGPPP